MGFGELVMLMCGLLWVMHAARLARAPLARAWPAFLIVALGVGATAAGYFLLREHAEAIAIAAAVVLLVAPALAVRGASRSLRFGRIALARVLAAIAYALRPLPIQARFRRAVEVSWRLARSEPVDIDRALDTFGKLEPLERRLHRVALLSWTNDFATMARELEDPRARSAAMRSGMAAILCTAVGETGTAAHVCRLHTDLVAAGALGRRTLDGASALLCTAAYLGDVETVRAQGKEMADDVPAERIAFVVATAEQRAGVFDAAEETLARALAPPGLTPSARARLEYRRDHPLGPLAGDELTSTVREDVRQRLEARRALAALGLGFRRPAPLTWAIGCALAAIFVWQSRQGSDADVFRQWGLVAPFVRSPELHRLLSYSVLHLDVAHLVVNLIGLVVFGRFVESHFGALGYALIYVGGALGGGLAFLGFSTRLGVAIGASGAVLALFGATMARVALDKRLRTSQQGRRELVFLGAIAVAQLVGDALLAQSSGSAHVGGFIVGFAAGAAMQLLRGRG